jgi:hypothetical protein
LYIQVDQIFPEGFQLKRRAIEFCGIDSHRNLSFAFYRFVFTKENCNLEANIISCRLFYRAQAVCYIVFLIVSLTAWAWVLYIVEKCTVNISLGEASIFYVHHHDLMTPFYMGSSADDICGLLFDSL